MANMLLHAAAKVTGATGAITASTGAFAASTHNGNGDNTLNLLPAFAVAAAECMTVINRQGAMAASGVTTFGVVHASTTAKRITSTQEAGAGGASVLANVDFDIMFFRITP